MRRQFAGLHRAAVETASLRDGLYLVQVRRVQYRWHARKAFYVLRFVVLEPKSCTASSFSAHLDCGPKALWKLAWFLRDFGYDTDLLMDDQVDEETLVGLRGVVKISHTTRHGIPVIVLEGFSPAERWNELSPATSSDVVQRRPEEAAS